MSDTTTVAEIRPSTDPLAMIAMAVARGVDAEQLGKLMDLQERAERNKALTVFADAVTAFQRDMPPVHKNKSVDGKYNYATYEHLMAIAGPLLRKNGIVVTFDTAPDGDMLRVVCRVRVGIHSEETAVTMPYPAGNRAVNASQIFGQAVSYGKRYALCAALNIVTTDEDTDANYDPPPQQQQKPVPKPMQPTMRPKGTPPAALTPPGHETPALKQAWVACHEAKEAARLCGALTREMWLARLEEYGAENLDGLTLPQRVETAAWCRDLAQKHRPATEPAEDLAEAM